jgi:hypothetical protein
MSDTNSLALDPKLQSSWGIHWPHRDPVRKDVAKLRSRATRLIDKQAAKTVLVEIDKAWQEITRPVANNKERKASLDTTVEMCGKIRKELERLESSQPKIEVIQPQKKTASDKEDKKLRQGLEQRVERIANAIDESFDGSLGQPLLLPEGDSALSVIGLTSALGSPRLALRDSIITSGKAAEIAGQLDGVEKLIQDSRGLQVKYRQEINRHKETLNAADELIKTVAKQMTRQAEASPLGVKRRALREALPPQQKGLLNVMGLRRLVEALDSETTRVNPQDIAGYVKSIEGEMSASEGVGKLLEAFDQKVAPVLEKLRLASLDIAEPVFAEWSVKAAKLRSDLASGTITIAPDQLEQKNEITTLAGAIGDALTRVQNDSGKRFDALWLAIEAADDKLKDLLTTHKDVLAKSRTKDFKFFAPDMKRIEGLIEALKSTAPSQGGALSGADVANLVAAEGMAKAVATQLKSFEDALLKAAGLGSDTSGGETKAANPATLFRALRKNLELAGKKDYPYTKYNASGLKKISDEFEKFKKAQPQMKAEDAIDKLTKLIEDFEKGNNEAGLIKAQVERVDYLKCTRLQQGIAVLALLDSNADIVGGPNDYANAFKAVRDLLKASPVDETKLTDAIDAVVALFDGIGSSEELLEKSNDSAKALKIKADETKKEDAELRRLLKERRRQLELRFINATDEVIDTKGDENILNQIKRMFDEAKAQIKTAKASANGDDEIKINKLLDRIANHIDLVTANPKGEVSRRIKELPELYRSWTGLRQSCVGNLKMVASKLSGVTGEDDEFVKKIGLLAAHIDEYRKYFAEAPDGLQADIETLCEVDLSEGDRRKAREHGLATVADLQRALRAHPLTAILAVSPMPEASTVPGRMMAMLDRLNFTILTSVE